MENRTLPNCRLKSCKLGEYIINELPESMKIGFDCNEELGSY